MQFGKWLASCPRVKNACVCLKDQLTTMVFSSRVGAAQVQGSGGVAAWTAPLARVRWAAPVTDDNYIARKVGAALEGTPGQQYVVP